MDSTLGFSASSGNPVPKKTLAAVVEFTPAYEASEDKYLVVGIRTSDDSAPRERVLRISSDGDMFKQIRNTIGEFRPMYRRLLSLKGVSSFGIYQCFIHSDDHAPRQLDRETQRSLELFFAAFRSGGNKKHGNHRWIQWVHQEFNSASVDPAEGKYTLELKLDWSAPKFVFWGMAPILLSIVIGLWYMLKPLEEGADYIAVVQTGWTIASYIVTAAAILLGILAAITQFGDV
ncbi:hypothetical protein CcaCcLH18_08873 [Colletotrichum camelliae]|nr:hypothetical protein CcaCcLH18_08873 [Colletotrichum camelliae]